MSESYQPGVRQTVNQLNTVNPTGESVYFTSLGCSKNLVDSQVMLGHMGLGGLAL